MGVYLVYPKIINVINYKKILEQFLYKNYLVDIKYYKLHFNHLVHVLLNVWHCSCNIFPKYIYTSIILLI